jgi:hypothetical protein
LSKASACGERNCPISRAAGAEGLDDFAVLGKHHDARVVDVGLAMTFADVDVAI